jgi:hypothetical protein
MAIEPMKGAPAALFNDQNRTETTVIAGLDPAIQFFEAST